MAWRFKASKYKNASPIVPKFENLIRDLSIGSYRSHGNFIAASGAFMAFNWETNGSNLALLPLDAKGRQSKAKIPLIYAHSDFVTDFQFSPFDDGLLATASQDLTIKLWRIPEKGLNESGLNQPELVLPSQPRRVETVNFHSTADCVLATTSANSLVVWDLIQAKELFNYQDHDDEIQSVAWQHNGKLLATQSKDKQLRILDPRSGKCVVQCESHQGIKDSKVVWINGSGNRLFTTGFSGDRRREITIRDLRNLDAPQQNLTLDSSAGILIPLYDPDTNMCFLAGKGDRNVQFIELSDKEPFIIEGLKYSGEQTKGACLVPKRVLDVMQGEVNRVLQLCDSSIVPITWQVPRKSYRDYHADIYPETNGLDASCGPSTWWQGHDDLPVSKMSLDPRKRSKENLVVFQGPLSDRDPNKKTENGLHTNGNNGSANNNTTASANNNPRFAKPTPRTRCVVTANSVSVSSTNPKPSIVPQDTTYKNGDKFLGNKEKSKDSVDDGLAALRRQPSIRDRKKLFEENIKKQQQLLCANINGTAETLIENKENQNLKEEAEIMEKNIKEQDETVQNSAENPIQQQSEPEPETEISKPFAALKKNIFLTLDKPGAAAEEPEKPAKKTTSKMFVRVAKFKHLKGEVILKGRIENVKNLSGTVPAECNFIKANFDRIAVPLTGPGGKLAVYETRKPGRLPDGVTPVLINGTTVLDFAFDPFDNSRLVAACDDGHIRVWHIPEGGLTHQVNEPNLIFAAHGDKIQIVKWHPLAQDVFVTTAFDRTVKIWDLTNTEAPKMDLEGHTDQVYSAEFSVCGRFLATVCRDGKIRIFEPRKSCSPISEGGEIVAKKGARVAWVLDGQFLIVTGFSKQSERQVMVYRTSDLQLVHNVVLDVSPAILVPFYDEDSNTLFLTSKGDTTVTTFEVSSESPYLFPLSPYRPASLHQGFAFLPKNVVDVKSVEFARAYRLTANTIEPIAFSVPRVKTAFFQDDLFPETKVLWEPTMSAQEWFAGSVKQARLVSLCPEGMPTLSSNKPPQQLPIQPQNILTAASTATLPTQIRREMAKEAEASLESSVSHLVETTGKLEQDNMETGVNEEEWNDDD